MLIDARNQADSLAYQVEKTVNENRERIAVGELSRIEAAIAEARKAAAGRRPRGDSEGRPTSCSGCRTRVAEQLYKGSQGSQVRRVPKVRVPSEFARFAKVAEADVKDGEVVDAEYAETK